MFFSSGFATFNARQPFLLFPSAFFDAAFSASSIFLSVFLTAEGTCEGKGINSAEIKTKSAATTAARKATRVETITFSTCSRRE